METSLALALQLIRDGVLEAGSLIDRMACAPARIMGLECGLQTGSAADMTIIDPLKEWTLDARNLKSKSRNTPFDGWRLKGKAVITMVGGRIVYQEHG